MGVGIILLLYGVLLELELLIIKNLIRNRVTSYIGTGSSPVHFGPESMESIQFMEAKSSLNFFISLMPLFSHVGSTSLRNFSP
jgi:hypothetical protein